MCGIAGIVNPKYRQGRETVAQMILAQRHRGPDSQGYWVDPEVPCHMGHSRLAVQDLSPSGHQPMHSSCGRFVISFNGEIYNHHEIRKKIDANVSSINWRGSSDTETVLESISCFGIQITLSLLIGMFAIAVWDKERKELWLIRDRFGEKPLYYYNSEKGFVYASEIKGIRAAIPGDLAVDQAAVSQYFAKGYILGKSTIYQRVLSVLPGSSVKVSFYPKMILSESTYWSAVDAALHGMACPRTDATLSEETDALDKMLRRSVRGQLLADVPVGALLSGGVDSSLVTALIQQELPGRVNTFSLGFAGAGFDEAPFAREVAAYLGTDHHELYINQRDVASTICKLPTMFDQPFADVSAIPTFLIAQFARNDVTVVLTGDGGDELFGGYRRYAEYSRRWSVISRIPVFLRPLLSSAIGLAAFGGHDRSRRRRQILKTSLMCTSFKDFYFKTHRHWLATENLLSFESPLMPPEKLDALCHSDINSVNEAMLLDVLTYLPGDILVKGDRASMASSLEMRIPLLDHRIFEWSWGLSDGCKGGSGNEKKILRALLHRYVPKHLVERPKSGFGIPIGQYLRSELRDWAEDLLEPLALSSSGFLRVETVRKKWTEHLAGSDNWAYHLWDVLMFQAWLRSVHR